MFCQRINDYCVASVEVEQKKKAWSSKIIHGISSASIPLTFEIQSYYTRYANLIFVVYFIFKQKVNGLTLLVYFSKT